MAAKILLKSNDDEVFEVDRKVISLSGLMNRMFSDLGMDKASDDNDTASDPILLPNVNGEILRKVIDWCEQHKEDPPVSDDAENENKERRLDDIPTWDMEFLKVEQGTLFELIQAANYLDISALHDVACKTVANMIKGKTPEQIREVFNIENDFTAEEEDQIRRENAWCEE